MILRVEKNEFFKCFGILIFMFFVLTVDFRISIFHNIYFAYAFAFIALVFIIKGAKIGLPRRLPISILLWLISIVFVLPTHNASYITKYIIALILLYCYSKNAGAGKCTVIVIEGFGILYAIFTFVFFALPNVYIENIVPYLADYLQSGAVDMIRSNRYPGLTGHYSTNGTYLAVGLGAMYSLLIVKNNKIDKYSFVYFLITLGALLLIGKRAHLVFSIAALFGVYWFKNSDKKKKRFIKLVGIVIGAAVLFIIALNQIPALGNTFNRFYETAEAGDFLMSRGVFYAKAWGQFLQHPSFGCGWRAMISDINHDVHNIYIQLLAETGIVGFTLYVGLILYGVVIGTKTLKFYIGNKNIITTESYTLLYFSMYYLYFFVLYGLTGNPLYDEQPFYILMISYGSIIYYSKKRVTIVRRLEIEKSTYINFP